MATAVGGGEAPSCEVEYYIHVEFDTHVWKYKANEDVFIEDAIGEIFTMLKEQHVPLTEPPHELLYNPELPENLSAKQKRNLESLEENRGTDRLQRDLPRSNSLVRISTKQNSAISPKGGSSWREIANVITAQQASMRGDGPMQATRNGRTTSFDLTTMMNKLSPRSSVIKLQHGKRLSSYGLPNESHLNFQSDKEAVPEGKPVFTGTKHFIRVHNAEGSYKTLFQPEDTYAMYLYEELTEKFNLTETENFRLFLLKNGIEIIVGDKSTPIKLLANLDEKEMESVRLIFKDAGARKGESKAHKIVKTTDASIDPILQESKGASHLDLSFYHVDEFPPEFFDLSLLINYTHNQAELETLPSLSHFKKLLEVRVVDNNFTKIPDVLFDLSTLIEIDMGNNMIREIPDDIAKLTNLTELYFYVNQIREIPESISALGNLRVLNISNNNIEVLPSVVLSSLPQLIQLKASKNKIKFIPDEIAALQQLADLDLSQNCIKEVPSLLGSIESLRWLDLQHNEITSLPLELNNLHHLEECLLSYNLLSSFQLSLPSINQLLLEYNNLEELEDINLEGITILNLSHNRLISLSNQAVSRMERLTKLYITHNQLVELPSSLGSIPSLTQLDCKNNKLRSIPMFSSTSHLKVLDCASNQLVSLPEGIDGLSSLWFVQLTDNPYLKSLSLKKLSCITDLYMGGCSPVELNNNLNFLPNLRSLDIGYAKLKTTPSIVTKMKGLISLCLAGNNLKSLPKEIGKLIGLRELYASCNVISSIPSSIIKLRHLTILDLSCNALKNVSELVKIQTLQWLDLSYNPSLKSLPAFETLPKLHTFHVFGCSPKMKVCAPLLHCSHLNITPSSRFLYSISDMKGRRDGMEDSMVIRGRYGGKEDWDAFCVLDGHGGRKVAEFGGEELLARIERLLEKTDCKHPKDVIRASFLKVQDAIKTTQIGVMEGSTAVLGLFLENELYVANAGDSRAVLCRNGKAVRLSHDHKPDLPEEERRIRDAGGFVSDGRINSILAVSRVFGDLALEKWISSDPFIEQITLTDDDEFLILGCDGIWDVMEDQTAVDLIRRQAKPIQAASLVRNYAHMLGSMDNISCCVIHLQKENK